MRRRDVLAGIGSAGVVVGGGAIAVYGLPSVDDVTDEADSDDATATDTDDAASTERHDPLEIETVDAPGSDAGTVSVPATDRPTFVDLFATWCPPCIDQMPALAEAHDRIGDEVLFLSVTSETVGETGSITEAELVDWWDEHDGDWLLGLDPTAELMERYLQGGYPSAVAIDDSGRVQWADSGNKDADELVAGIERALETSSSGGGDG